MNWFRLAALATLEMSSSIHVAIEVKFIGFCYESTAEQTLRWFIYLALCVSR